MKRIIPFLLLLSLVASCNSKTNVVRVDDSRGDSSSGGSSGGSGGSGSGSGSDSGSGSGSGTVTTPNKGCVADGNQRSDNSATAPYISIPNIIVSGESARYSTISQPAWSSNGNSYAGRLYSDSILKIRLLVNNERPSMGSSLSSANGDKDYYNRLCNAENVYNKVQVTIGVRAVGSSSYYQTEVIQATTRNDCSSIKTFMVPPNSPSHNRPIVVDVLSVQDDTRCIWANNNHTTYCPIYDVPQGTKSVQCVKFTLQIETDNTLALPPKS